MRRVILRWLGRPCRIATQADNPLLWRKRALRELLQDALHDIVAGCWEWEEPNTCGVAQQVLMGDGVHWLLTSESASRILMNACLVTPSRRAS